MQYTHTYLISSQSGAVKRERNIYNVDFINDKLSLHLLLISHQMPKRKKEKIFNKIF